MNQVIAQQPELTIYNVPLESLRFIEKGLAQYGATITFFAPHIGIVKHDSGELHFYWQCEDLIVHVWKESGHFPVKLLIGGIRQFVEEAVEDWRVEDRKRYVTCPSCKYVLDPEMPIEKLESRLHYYCHRCNTAYKLENLIPGQDEKCKVAGVKSVKDCIFICAYCANTCAFNEETTDKLRKLEGYKYLCPEHAHLANASK